MSEQEIDKAKVDAKAGGAAAGGTAGALIGSVVGGPVGSGVGGVLGTALGGALGVALDYIQAEPVFRDEWERGPYKESSTWDEASAAYRYGWESFNQPEYQGRPWDEVSSDLKGRWSGTTRWEDYEPMVRSAWDRRSRHQVGSGAVPDTR